MSKEFIPIDSIHIQREPLNNNYGKSVQKRYSQWQTTFNDAKKHGYEKPEALILTNIACGKTKPDPDNYARRGSIHTNPIEVFVETLQTIEELAMKNPNYAINEAIKISSNVPRQDIWGNQVAHRFDNANFTGNIPEPGFHNRPQNPRQE